MTPLHWRLLLVIALSLCRSAVPLIQLNDANFYTEIKEYRLALVLFYAPWCDHCAHLLPEFEAAAEYIAEDRPEIAFITVDAIENDAVAGGELLQGFPTLKIYIKGTFYETYTSSWDAVGLAKTMRWYNKPVSKKLSTAEEAEAWIAAATDTVVLGTFPGIKDDAFDKLAKDLRSEYRFAYVPAAELPGSLRVGPPAKSLAAYAEALGPAPEDDTLFVLKAPRYASRHESLVARRIMGEQKKMQEFIFKTNLPLVGEINDLTRGRYYDYPVPLVTLYFDVDYATNAKRTKYVSNRLRRVAADWAHRRCLFAVARRDPEPMTLRFGVELAEGEFAVSFERGGGSEEWHVFRGLMAPDGHRGSLGRGGWSADALRPWLEDLMGAEDVEAARYRAAGIAPPPPLPAAVAATELPPWPEEAAVVGAWELDSEQLQHLVVNHADKDVFVAVVARWCPYCTRRAPVIDKLARIFGPHGVVVAKLYAGEDGESLPGRFGLDVGIFPAFFHFKRNKDPEKREAPRRYLGVQEVLEMEIFIRAEAQIKDTV